MTDSTSVFTDITECITLPAHISFYLNSMEVERDILICGSACDMIVSSRESQGGILN